MKKTKTRILSLLLVALMLLSVFPITVFAAPASDIPAEMLDNVYLDALAYTGYRLQAQKDDGQIYKVRGDSASAYLSKITYGTDSHGTETVSDSSTVTGKAPDIATFEDEGLCCASYTTYVYFNYLPNIAGVDTSEIERPTNLRSASSWYEAANGWIEDGSARKISFTQDSDGDNFSVSEEIPIGSLIVFKAIDGGRIAHVALYAGEYDGRNWLTHVGNSRGPEFSSIEGMSKGGTPEAVALIVVPDFVENSGKIEIYKKDPQGNPLSGAYFTATNTEDNTQYIIGPTDSNGYAATTEDIDYGTYHVVETVFPENYTASGETEWTVTVDATNDGLVVIQAVNVLKKGYIEVFKSDAESGQDLSGAEFTVYNEDDEVVTVIGPTDSSGYAKSELITYGNYVVRETKIPANYQKGEESEWEVTIDDTAPHITLDIPNDRLYGSVRVTKTAEDGFVKDVEFRLKGTSVYGDTVDLTARSNANGVVLFKDVPIGKEYVLSEENVQAYYDIPDSRTVVVEWNKVAEIEVYNELKRSDLIVTKNAEDGLAEGAKFHLYGVADCGQNVNEYAIVDSSGKAYFNDILVGSGYVLEEVETDNKYIIPDSQIVTIEWDTVTEAKFDNTLKRGSLTVTKTAEDNLVEGAKFHLYGTSESGIAVDEYAIADSTGKAYFKDVLIGSGYVLEEVETENKYIVPDKQTVAIEWNIVTEKSFYNELKRGNLTVTKTAEDGLVEGAKFHLYGTSESGIAVDEYATADSTGKAYFKDVLIGSGYILEEVETENKYIVPGKQTVTIEWNIVTEKSFYNELKRGNLTVTKTAEDGLVEGAKFHLYGTADCGQQVDEYAVADNTGKAHFMDILVGSSYILEEVETGDRYVVPEKQTVDIEWNTVTETSVNNTLKKWNATVTKFDSENGEAQGDATLEGAVYGVYEGDTLIDTYTTDHSGQFTTDYYVCGDNWSIREVTPSEGYLLDGTIYHVGAEAKLYTVEYNSIAADVTEQVIKGKISLIKHTDNGDTQLETPEVGAEFEVYLKSAGAYANAKESERDYLICDENGFAETKLLPYGIYSVDQVSGWDGRALLADFDVYIAEDGRTYRYLANNAVFSSYLKIVKTDVESGLVIPYAGAGFEIYRPDGTKVTMQYTYPELTVVDVFYTNSEGYLITPETLPYGEGYYLIEVKAPQSYVLDSTPVYFDITEENSITEGTVTLIEVSRSNMPQKGIIHITKSGEVFRSVITVDEQYRPVYEIKGLQGAIFEIRAAEDIYTLDGVMHYAKGELVDTIETGSDGIATSRELYLGKYEILEVKAPHSMVLNPEIQTVELIYGGQEVSVTQVSGNVYNERQKVKVSLRKELEQSDLFGIGMNGELAKVTFGLYAATDIVAADGSTIPVGGLIEVIRFDEKGNATCTADLPLGSYYLQERTTDSHYILSDAKYGFEFTYASQETEVVEIVVNDGEAITNDLKYGSVSGLKVDEDGKTIAGAIFGLFGCDEKEYSFENAYMTAESASDGRFIFENIPVGNWTVRELRPATGFVLNETVYPVNITENAQVVEITMENRYIRGSIAGLKVDEDGKTIAGAMFGLFPAGTTEFTEVNALMLAETDAEGKFSFDNVRFGSWIVRELKAAEGYVLNEAPIEVEITDENEIIEIEFENKFIRGDIKGHKVDEDGNSIAGALFGLFKEGDIEFTLENAVLLAESDENGIFLFEDIRYGNWIIRELKPAEGFVPNDNLYSVTIAEEGTVIEIEIENRHITGSAHTTKVDVDFPENLLTGAIFEIYMDADGNKVFDSSIDLLVGEMTEYELGKYSMADLRFGGYFLYEKQAPVNFVKDDGYYYFEIINDGEVVEIENEAGIGFVNCPKVGSLKIVKTSSDGRLEGFSFRVIGENYDEVFTTDAKGEIYIENLRIGKYTVSEVEDSVSGGYIRPDPVEIELVTGETLTVEAYNEKIIEEKPPQTGDNSNLMLNVALAIVGMSGIGVLLLISRRKRSDLEDGDEK